MVTLSGISFAHPGHTHSDEPSVFAMHEIFTVLIPYIILAAGIVFGVGVYKKKRKS